MNVYRLLLRLLPSRVRERHSREMEMLFRERLAEVRRRSRAAACGVWIRAGADIVVSIPHEIRRARRLRGQIGIPAERRSFMIGSDIRYAWRSLSHQRLGTALVVGMLALGIGATVAVFSLINGLFLRPFPFPEPDRLVFINETAPKWNLEMTGINYADFAQWHRDQQAFEAIAVYDSTAFNVATDQGADRLSGAAVSIDFLEVLGLRPLLGRSFAADEVKPNGPRVTMIGEALWHERFGGRRDALGKELRLNSRSYTVIGVLPRAAEFPGGVRLWVPIQADPDDRDSYDLDGFGRLKPGVTVEQAGADLLRAHQPIFDVHDKERVVSPFVRDLRTQLTRDFGTIASTLGAAVGLLLLVACANVAALMLARALARRREIGIRLAVGASRTRLLRQLLVENILLSIAGGVLGLALGHAAIQLLVTSLPDQAPGWTAFTLDTRIVSFTLLTSMLTVVLFGWAPALHAMNSDVRGAMSAAAAGSTLPVRGRRTLWALVAGEFALASLMFVCGGLLVRAYDRVRTTDPGFDGSNVLTFNVNIPLATYADDAMRIAFWNRLQERMRVLPGVEKAGVVSCAPVSGCHWGQFYSVDGAPPRSPNDVNPVVLNRVATADYFPAMGIRLKDGRVFTDTDAVDTFDKESVVVVNETFVKTFWPGGGSPIGQRVRSGEQAPWRTVVGVVHDVKHYGLEQPMRPGLYLPITTLSGMTVVLRTAGDPAAIAPAARAALREVDPELPAYDMRTMDERLAQSRSLRATYSWMLGVFAMMALLLAIGGSYGVTQYLVSQRTRELGIRVALGAGHRDISRAVLTGSLAVVATGVLLGIAGAIGAGRFLASLLFGVPSYDAAILAVAAVVLLSTGLLANWLPARRASKADPMISLRAD